jgi:hypothetical protein
MIISAMSRTLAVALLVLAASSSRGATPVSIEVRQPRRIYPTRTVCDLNKVDFRNFTYFIGDWWGPVRVSQGKRIQHGGGFDDYYVRHVLRPDLRMAIVSLLHSYGGGSSDQDLIVMIFQCVDGKLTNTQLIQGDGHGDGAGVIFSNRGKQMIMNSTDDYTVAHCCPRYLETAVFRLGREGYVLVDTHQKENRYH